MKRSARLLIVFCIATAFLTESLIAADVAGQWKITSIRLCRNASGTLVPSIEAIGQFPVYTFFIPRPIWTVNGTVVEGQPYYDKGRLASFKLSDAAPLLKTGTKNTIKFSLPDQTNSKVFQYDQSRPAPGECYEFF
ncbi:MAG TPA: hypothetical protein VK463_18200 [Desulfomonilaceae bacterium]|nr:hypothetical protein [Desulfomonilaceae bacterium]